MTSYLHTLGELWEGRIQIWWEQERRVLVEPIPRRGETLTSRPCGSLKEKHIPAPHVLRLFYEPLTDEDFQHSLLCLTERKKKQSKHFICNLGNQRHNWPQTSEERTDEAESSSKDEEDVCMCLWGHRHSLQHLHSGGGNKSTNKVSKWSQSKSGPFQDKYRGSNKCGLVGSNPALQQEGQSFNQPSIIYSMWVFLKVLFVPQSKTWTTVTNIHCSLKPHHRCECECDFFFSSHEGLQYWPRWWRWLRYRRNEHDFGMTLNSRGHSKIIMTLHLPKVSKIISKKWCSVIFL